MDVKTLLLVAAALAPAVVLCIYVFRKDRVEKEPIGLLMALLGLGVVSCFPAMILEGVMEVVIDSVFAPLGVQMADGIYLDGFLYEIYLICENFIGIALVEEGLKFLVLVLVTRNNKNFNSLFDGIIYAVFVSLGFAALENVLYVLEYGFNNAVMRAIFAVPGHMFDAVLMGYGYSYWHMVKEASKIENNLRQSNVLPATTQPFAPNKFLAWSLIVPVLAHGFYDYCCSSDLAITTVAFYLFVGFLYFHCFGKIKKMSKLDGVDSTYALIVLLAKYPPLGEHFRNMKNPNGEPVVAAEALAALEAGAREFRMEHFT